MTHKTIQEAKREAINAGAVTFRGTVENCNTMTFYDKEGERLGHLYASYDYGSKRIYKVRHNAEN